MLCLPKHIITPLAGGLIAMMALLGACDKRPAPGHVLEKNAEFTVSTDSVVQGEWLAWAGDDGKWHCNVTAASLDSVHATTDSMRFTQGNPLAHTLLFHATTLRNRYSTLFFS